MTNARAVLFDMDGTLLDTLEDIADSMNAALVARGLPVHPVAAYRGFVGDGVERLVRRALPQELVDEDTVASCVAQMRAEYARRWHAKTRPYPGIPQLLDTLTAHGLCLAILSNKPHDFTVRIAERLLARWSFDPVLGARAGVPKKPDPGAALEIAGQRGIPPEAWLYLGDTSTDMETATAAGMFPVGVLWGFRGAAELEASGARLLIQRPDQLLELL